MLATLARVLFFASTFVYVVHATSCDVTHRGALGDGVTDDTTALQSTLDDFACDEVVLPSGKRFASSVLRVRRSNLVVTIENETVLLGLPDKIKRPECNETLEPEWRWKDWCAFIKVDSERNFTLQGSGAIIPGGVSGKTPDIYSALHVKSTIGVVLSGLRIDCTNFWWCTAMHNATDVHVSNLFVNGSSGRDGMDLVNCRRVLIEDSRIEGSDDGICFKTISDSGLSSFPAADVVVRRSVFHSQWCNAIQFGSATEVNMWNFSFYDVVITRAPKAAIGIISMDSANISGISFRNVSILDRNVATPLYMKIGNRVKGEAPGGLGHWTPGSIANVNFTDVTAVGWGNVSQPKPGHGQEYTATIEGLNSSHPIGPVRMHNVRIVAPGGGTAKQEKIEPPISPLAYQPRYTGVRPAWGLFIRHATGISLSGVTLATAKLDGRPAIVADDVEDFLWLGGQVNSSVKCQLETRNVRGHLNSSTLRACNWTPEPHEWLHPVWV